MSNSPDEEAKNQLSQAGPESFPGHPLPPVPTFPNHFLPPRGSLLPVATCYLSGSLGDIEEEARSPELLLHGATSAWSYEWKAECPI